MKYVANTLRDMTCVRLNFEPAIPVVVAERIDPDEVFVVSVVILL